MANTADKAGKRIFATMKSFFILATGMVAYVAPADVWVWTGAQDAYWTNAANWAVNSAVATTPPGRFLCDGADSGAFDSSVEFGDVAWGAATTIDLDGFRDVSNLVVSAESTRYQFGTSNAQSLTIHSTAGVFRVQSGALAPVMAAQFGAWRYGADPGAKLDDAGTAKIVNDSEETLEFSKMFYVENSAKDGEKPIRFEGTGDIKISGLCTSRCLIYLDLAQTDGAKIIWNCRADGAWRSRFRNIRNAVGYVSEIELLEGSFLSGYTGMGPFDIGGTLTLSGPGEYQCNVGVKNAKNATDGNLYLDQQNTISGTMYVRCRVTSYSPENSGYFGGWTIYGGTGTTYFDGDIDNEMLGDAKILVTSDSSAYENRPTFSVGEIGAAGEQGPLGMAGVTVSGGGRLLYTGPGETCTRPFCITNRVPKLQNAKPIDMNPCAVIEQGGAGKLTFNSPIVSYGLCLNGSTVKNATLELANSTSQEAEIGTVLSDNVDKGTLSLVKKGSGMWRLAKENGYTGATTIQGGALVIGAEGSVSASSSLVMKGGDLVLESDSGATRSVSVPTISISSGVNRIMVADGVSVTVAGLSVGAGTLDVQISGSGSFAVTGLSEVPSGVTIGGRPVEIGADGKFSARGYVADIEIAARGGKISDAPGKTVGITSSGGEDAGPVVLEDGVSSATIRALVQKTDTPATVALSPGQTLSADVVAVEAGRAALTIGSAAATGTLASSGDLGLDNMSGNPLTVLASLSVPSSSSIQVTGAGLTRLWWPADWAGKLNVVDGSLALTNDSDIAFTSTISGNGEFRKEGSGTWTMTKPQDTTFSGDFTVAGGEVSFSDAKVFGSKTEGKVAVADGATLKPTTYGLSMPPKKKLHLAGRGPSGEGGALDLEIGLFYAPDVELDGDARITSSNGMNSHLFLSEQKVSGKLDMNGHSLNFATNVALDMYSVKVTDPGAFVYEPYDVYGNKWSCIYLYNDCDLGGEDAPCIEATVGSRLSIDQALPPVRRKLRITIPTDSQYAEASITGGMKGRADGVNTNFAQWAGPIEIVNAGTKLSLNPWDPENADRYITISGKISGAGDVNLGRNTKSGTKGHVLLMNPGNTYTGSTVLNGENGTSLTLFHPGSLPDWSKLSVYGCGRVGMVAGEGFFSADEIVAAANTSATLNVSSVYGCKYLPGTLVVNTSYLPDRKFSLSLADDDITREDGGFSIGHDGKGELALTGSWTKPVRFSCFDGVLRCTGPGVMTLGAGIISGNWMLSVGEVLIEDAEDVRFTQNNSVILGGYGNVIAGGRMTIRDSRVTRFPSNGKWNSETFYDSTIVGSKGVGIVTIEGRSVVTNRHVIGYDSSGCGAVCLRGGRLVEYCPDPVNEFQSSVVGNNGYGYFEVGAGTVCDIHGKQYLGQAEGGQGVFVQKGGVVNHSKPWKTGYDNNWTLANGKGSAAVVMIEGGVHTNAADTSICNGADSRAYFTIEGGEYINQRPANPNRAQNANSLTVINLNGGVFSAWSVAKARASYPEGVVAGAYVNFDGGTFLGMKNNYWLFGAPGAGSWSEAVDRVTVYGGGAVIDIASGITQYADVAMSAPTGNGVASVAWSDTGVKYVGSPVVEIIGDGTGASAFAEFDSVNRKVTGIKVTSAGCDYTWAKAVIRYGNEVAVTNTAVTLAPQTSGSFTKKGLGTLCLNVANTYGGDTVVEDGVLIVNTAGAIPEGSKIVLKGGVIVAGDGVQLPASVFRFDVLAPVAYPGEFGFPEGSSIEIANLDKVDKSVGSYVLATFDGGLSGAVPEVANKDDLPPRWYLMKSGKSLKVRYSRGSAVLFR